LLRISHVFAERGLNKPETAITKEHAMKTILLALTVPLDLALILFSTYAGPKRKAPADPNPAHQSGLAMGYDGVALNVR
jgi:hypothetical protein